MPEPAHRTRPVQVAKRKQKPLGQEEPVVKKKSKTTKATTEGDEASNASDEQDEPKTFISPEKYLDKAIVREDDEEPRVFVSPLQYMYLANEHDERPRVGRKSHEKGQVDKESSTRPSSNKPSSSQPPPHVEKSTEPSVDRFVTDAQEELMRMIDDRASDKAIEYQMKIIKMFRARLPSQDELQSSTTQKQQPRQDIGEDPQTKAPNKDVGEPSRSTLTSRHPMSISPSSSPASSSSSTSTSTSPPTPSPAPKKRPTRTSIAKAKNSRETKELLKTARPASAPTSLPAAQRTNKSLTTKEVAKLSKVHTTFDEAKTNKLDRHTRKFNSTKGMASDKPAMPERGLESRIRAPTESPPEALRNSRRGSGQRLDAAALRAASTAAAEGRRQWSGGRFTSSNQPGKGKVNTSPRELEESVRAMNESLMSCDMPSTPTAATAATAATALGRPGGINGRPGQVYNAVTKRWEYVEEVDSDDD